MAPDEVDHHAVGAAITTIGSNLPEMTKEVKKIIAFSDDKPLGDKLLDATRTLCKAFSDLLKAAEPESKEVGFLKCHSPRKLLYCLIATAEFDQRSV